MDDLISNLQKICPDVDFAHQDKLVTSGILTSFDIIQIVVMIGAEYDVKVPVSELRPANFDSAEAIFALIERLEEE